MDQVILDFEGIDLREFMKQHIGLVGLLVFLNTSFIFANGDSTDPASVPPTSQKSTQNTLQEQLQKIESSVGRGQDLPPPVAQPVNTNSPTASSVAPPVVAGAPAASVPIPAPAGVGTTDSSGSNGQQQQPSEIENEAFSNVTKTLLPLSTSQIEMLRGLYDDTQRAAAVFPGTPPKPISTSISVDLSPGKTPPIIRLGAGFVTSLVFVDSTGAPWPIASYSLGNPSAFNIQWDRVSNILLMQAITSHRVANLAVILKGLNTPVMINLTPGQAAMDARVDLRIPGLGPTAKVSAFSPSLPGTESPVLMALLDGIPPQGAKALKTTGCENCAWLFNGKLYLRMQYTLLSPGWISTLSSADGTNVYELQPTPLVLASYNGKTIQVSVEGF
ncbi:MAG: icmK [Gammaproteobacteria bacterium]|nr:icmK [Gammaproteobacteria bacterium]